MSNKIPYFIKDESTSLEFITLRYNQTVESAVNIKQQFLPPEIRVKMTDSVSSRMDTLLLTTPPRFVALSDETYPIFTLSSIYNTTYAPGIAHTCKNIDQVNLNVPWLWVLDSTTKHSSFAPNIAVEDFYECMLLNIKYMMLYNLVRRIYFYRKPLQTQLIGQDTIYRTKYDQAREIVARGLSADDNNTYPLVSLWAKYNKDDLQVAAKEIIFKHEDWSYKMATTEVMRMKYTNLIKDASSFNDLYMLMAEFEQEGYKYAKM